jgi:hypothetical protein
MRETLNFYLIYSSHLSTFLTATNLSASAEEQISNVLEAQLHTSIVSSSL